MIIPYHSQQLKDHIELSGSLANVSQDISGIIFSEIKQILDDYSTQECARVKEMLEISTYRIIRHVTSCIDPVGIFMDAFPGFGIITVKKTGMPMAPDNDSDELLGRNNIDSEMVSTVLSNFVSISQKKVIVIEHDTMFMAIMPSGNLAHEIAGVLNH